MLARSSSYAPIIYGLILVSHHRALAASPSSLSARLAAPKCSWRANNTIGENTLQFPCGDDQSTTYTCCSAGNTCYQDGLCGFPAGQSEGYYIGGCTDSAYKAPQCNMNCTDMGYQNVMWNDTLQLWACCTALPSNSSAFNCTQPFAGPAPVDLAASFTVAASSATSTPASAAAPTPSAAQTTPATAAATPTPETTGAGVKAGIGVAVVLGVGAVCLAAWLISRRYRQRLRRRPGVTTYPPRAWIVRHEMAAGSPVTELESVHFPKSKREGSALSSKPTSEKEQMW